MHGNFFSQLRALYIARVARRRKGIPDRHAVEGESGTYDNAIGGDVEWPRAEHGGGWSAASSACLLV